MRKALGLVVAVIVALGVPVPASAAPGGCATTVGSGAVAGRSAGGVCVFRGIPYAASPTGELRFRPPQPARAWSGTLQAVDGGAVCPQFRDRLTEDYPDDRQVYLDEDCLRVNVWTPAADRGRRPVIVFVHGGAAQFGTGNEPRYDGTNLAARGDAVVVTVNYRLGALGWLELGDLDPAYRGSGNNGLRDQIAALTWVRQNIAAFGGDPDNVTAVAQSEGAFCLSAILATEQPQKLLRRAVLQSGSGYMVHSRRMQQTVDRQFRDANGITSAGQVLSMSTVELLAAQEKAMPAHATGFAVYFGPRIDGELVQGPLIDRVNAGNTRGIDLLIGTTRDEVRFFTQIDPGMVAMTQADYDPLFPAPLADRRARITRAYGDDILASLTDQFMRVPATRLAAAQNKWGRAYLYRFDWAPVPQGAVHTGELPFVFGTLRFAGIPGGEEALARDRARMTSLSNEMMGSWTSFARRGDPGWPRYAVFWRFTRIWDTPSWLAIAPDDTRRAVWDAYPFAALDVAPEATAAHP
ncbi:carboxylesterase/lipase family protein [Actinokineospora enzanensis]|uniref:carboxylesterase/lipase family protein n=1 Tax=Actinokineospora enzanensis TaxID=155975 RepID=UPI0009FF8634|nr:carboxylesterase family protein [Actinokineospora enzanensis]